MKYLLGLLLMASTAVAYAAWIPIPRCTNGKWTAPDANWTIEQAESAPVCSADSDILPHSIYGKFVNKKTTGLGRYTMTVKFYNKNKEVAVTLMSHKFAPWGGAWTGYRRSKLAYCPSETGLTGIGSCPIVQDYKMA